MAGRAETVRIVIRGNSGSGKSTIATQLRARHGRGIAVIAQDDLCRAARARRAGRGEHVAGVGGKDLYAGLRVADRDR